MAPNHNLPKQALRLFPINMVLPQLSIQSHSTCHLHFSSSHTYATLLFTFFLLPLVRTSIQPKISLTARINARRSLPLPPIFLLLHLPFLIMHVYESEFLFLQLFSDCSKKALKWAVDNVVRDGDYLISITVRPEGNCEEEEMQLLETTGHWFISVFIWIRSFNFINLFCKWILRIQLIKFVHLVNFDLLFYFT